MRLYKCIMYHPSAKSPSLTHRHAGEDQASVLEFSMALSLMKTNSLCRLENYYISALSLDQKKEINYLVKRM